MTAAARALAAACAAAADGADAVSAVRAGAEAVAGDGWRVVAAAGPLARARWAPSSGDVGLTEALGEVDADDPRAVTRVAAGCPRPHRSRSQRRRAGAYDTPPSLARRVVALGRDATRGRVDRALDPACGVGALLVALGEAGLPALGTDPDPMAVAVARVAAPAADVRVGDAFDVGEMVDLVVGNPPFVAPERQDKALRASLRARFPWLSGRFDLAVPLVAAGVARVRPGGGVAFVLPAALCTQPYAAPLRRDWLTHHRFTHLGEAELFPGASVRVALVAMTVGEGAGPVPPAGLDPSEILALARAPLDPAARPGDAALVATVRAHSVPLGELARVDTGVVAHGALGGKAALMADGPGEGVVPYADAADVFADRTRWLHYRPEVMHRAKDADLFEPPKLIVQRLVGDGPVKVRVDRTGLWVGHTCTVAVPHAAAAPLEAWARLLAHPAVRGVWRIEHGRRLDLYPRDVAGVPVPRAWDGEADTLARAWGLDAAGFARLCDRGAVRSG